MRFLLLGYSDIARRRVLPALLAAGVEDVDIATVSTPAPQWSCSRPAGVFHDYDRALHESRAEIVYVSCINSFHAHWAERALRSGRHVIVDKPAFLELDDGERLVELAAREKLCLAEANVYAYHPRFRLALDVFRGAQSEPTHVVAVLTIPPLPAANYRNRHDLGGGALWDLGPYAVSLGRTVFGCTADEIVARRLSTNGSVDTSFSMIAAYPMGRTVVGCFGFTTEYANHLELLGLRALASFERAFSPPAGEATSLFVRRADQPSSTQVPASDSFSIFIRDVIDGIDRRTHERFSAWLLQDARELNRLRRSALAE